MKRLVWTATMGLAVALLLATGAGTEAAAFSVCPVQECMYPQQCPPHEGLTCTCIGGDPPQWPGLCGPLI